MANFKTHVSIAFSGCVGSGLLAIHSQLISWYEAPWLIFLGTMGGLLPDIDSDQSKQVKVIFFMLAIAACLILLTDGVILQGISSLFPTQQVACHALKFDDLLRELSGRCLSYATLFSLLSVFVLIRYGLSFLFRSVTVHRGVFHSLLSAVFFILLTTVISYYALKQTILFSWLSGVFLGIGFIIHLLLDEIYSVDLANSRLKRSFGTAFKLYGYQSKIASLLMLFCTLYLYSITPSHAPLLNALQTAKTTLQQNSDTIYSIQLSWLDYLLQNLHQNT